MEINQLTALLANLTGHLHSSSAEDEKNVEKLQASIAEALLHQDSSTVLSQEFIFERSDLFISANIESKRLEKISELATLAGKSKKLSETNVFVRNVPVRSTQIMGGITSASAGARVKTVGPVPDMHGVSHWFDFVKIKKLIALYVEGKSLPVILFNTSFKIPKSNLKNSEHSQLTRSFTIDPDSVWIHGQVFSPDVPDEYYCGLRVKGGAITLDTAPFIASNHLTTTNTTLITCVLKLEQNDVFDSDPSSKYGMDARKASFHLPDILQFTFKNNVKKIVAVSDARWMVYGQKNKFFYQNVQDCIYNPVISRVQIPMQCENSSFKVEGCMSPFFHLNGSANIKNSWWALSVTKLDIARPLEADGNGAIIIQCDKGLDAKWTNLQNKSVTLMNPYILGEPGRIGITDLTSDGSGAFQQFNGWKDTQNIYGTTLECRYNKDSLLIFNTIAGGDELIFGLSDWDVKTDRPVKVNGEAVAVKTKDSVFIIGMSRKKTLLIVIDENILWDNKLPSDKIPHIKPYALAMHNALFTVTPPNSLVLFAESTSDLKVLTKGQMYLGFGLYSYLPTLPDPYAANLGILKGQFALAKRSNMVNAAGTATKKGSSVWLWLIGLVKWELTEINAFKVGVSFHFAPLSESFPIEKETQSDRQDTKTEETGKAIQMPDMFSSFSTDAKTTEAPSSIIASGNIDGSDAVNNNLIAIFNSIDFSLVDVSSKANQMGISYAKQNNQLQAAIARQFNIDIKDEANATAFPILIRGLDVITAGMNAQAFTFPAIAWEPVFNLTNPNPAKKDPPIGFNYYQNDGIATRIGNLSRKPVVLSPIPMAKYLVDTYKDKEDGRTFAIFNLPFGMLAVTILNNKSNQDQKPIVLKTSPTFENYLNGGIQLELTAGTSFNSNDSDTIFEGYTIQLLDINNSDGSYANASTLGDDVWTMFNDEFFTTNSNSPLPGRPAVPVKNIGLSGYGANMFSEWQNKNVLVGASQAYFNVITGRTSYEVVQVKSKLYCCGADVVRTITLFRLANGYVARIDSGWESRSEGKYNFVEDQMTNINNFNFYPGIVRGYYNIRNIKELPQPHVVLDIPHSPTFSAVTYDADIELENVTEGGHNNIVSAKSILGYVQLLPLSVYIKDSEFVSLLKSQNNSIGGSLSCLIKVAGTKQRMKINRVDVSASIDKNNNAIFVCSARGSVIMPKDGSWTMVQHNRGTGEVSPLPEQLSVPLIRDGLWDKDNVVKPAYDLNLIRIAQPEDLLKVPDNNTINFGFLQNMGTQKVLFMTPCFKKGRDSLLSKTPPLLADSFRLLNSKGIFPNIGDIENNFGQAISLLKGIDVGHPLVSLDVFNKIPTEIGDMFNLLQLQVAEEAGKLVDQGYELAKGAVNGVVNKALQFDLPSFDYPLINLPGKLIIAIQYRASSKPKDQPQQDYVGKFDFNVNSLADNLEETWKARMNNLAMVVSIGPLTDVMTIKGNFNSQKGKDVDLGSGITGELPLPEIEFSDALKPVIQILEILASLSSGEYGDALKKGLKIAMSNSANIWEYKFEANKDIPLIQFPPDKVLYESPTTPLKLEASLGIGVFFNAALKVTTDPSQLLPTAGGYFKFHGGLQVMCSSVGGGTIYAVGNVDLKLEADTSPKVAVDMKFGFGAQITVGLPVVGNASVLFMLGVEVYADSSSVVRITAIMLFKGQAELLGGLVSVTITIEAKGSIEKIGTPPPGQQNPPTTCKAQVTFAVDISIFLVIDISFSESWEETRQIA